MQDLKERLSVKGSKCNLQFSTKERLYYEQEAGFTVIQISHEMTERHDRYYSVSTIEGRIRSIKDKILRIL